MLVTGASRGIGSVIAKQFARAGAAVALVARSADSLKDVQASILKEAPGVRVLTFAVDVKDPVATERVLEETVAQFGGLDVLVANAGVGLPMSEKRECPWKAGCLQATHSALLGIGERDDPLRWWNSFEVNIRGALCYVQ